MRARLRSAVCCLADERIQARIWGSPTAQDFEESWDFDDAIEMVIDDIDITKAQSYLDVIFLDTAEVRDYELLGNTLLRLISRFGGSSRYLDVNKTPEWDAVVQAAVVLCHRMSQHREAEIVMDEDRLNSAPEIGDGGS